MTYTLKTMVTNSNKIESNLQDNIKTFKNGFNKGYKTLVNDIFSKVLKTHIKKKKDNTLYFDLKSLEKCNEYNWLANKIFNNLRSYVIKSITLGKTKVNSNLKNYINNEFKTDNVYKIRGIFENGILNISKKTTNKNTTINNKSNEKVSNKDTSNALQSIKCYNEFSKGLYNSIIKHISKHRLQNKELDVTKVLNIINELHIKSSNLKKVINQ